MCLAAEWWHSTLISRIKMIRQESMKQKYLQWRRQYGAATILQRVGTGKTSAMAAALGACLLLPSCAPLPQPSATPGSPITTHVAAPSPVVSRETQTLSPEDMARLANTTPDLAYQLGPNDVISLSVYMHPELSVPAVTGVQGGGTGALITGDGTVQLPLIGEVKLGGLTLLDAQTQVTAAYQGYLKNPKVTLGLMEAHSLRYYLLGMFSDPGIKYPGHELSLLEALALGGSVDVSQADLYQAYVAQGNVKLPVDLHALLIDGDLQQNISLVAGDTIVVPSSANENAFVLGAVGQPGAVKFQGGSLSLLQALSAAGLDLPNYTDARLAQVRIIRSEGPSADFYVVNASKILTGQAQNFALQPGDVVFVPPTAVATWNQALRQLIPTLQTISYSLSPFVSIKYLENN
jgi:polysaccharide export outer membrane protein